MRGALFWIVLGVAGILFVIFAEPDKDIENVHFVRVILILFILVLTTAAVMGEISPKSDE